MDMNINNNHVETWHVKRGWFIDSVIRNEQAEAEEGMDD